MHVANGWTALWDGIRRANELLDAGAVVRVGDASCYGGTFRSIVVLTDGRDNNSAGEHVRDDDDGIATRFDELLGMNAGGASTGVSVVGIGDDIDEPLLRRLATETGGTYRSIAGYAGLVGALHGEAAKMQNKTPVCFRPADCGDDEVRVTVALRRDGEFREVTTIARLPSACAR